MRRRPGLTRDAVLDYVVLALAVIAVTMLASCVVPWPLGGHTHTETDPSTLRVAAPSSNSIYWIVTMITAVVGGVGAALARKWNKDDGGA